MLISNKHLATVFAALFIGNLSFSQWTQKGADIYGQAAQDLFGTSVAMSNDGFVIATGAPEHTTLDGQVGMVRVHEWDGTNWVQRGQDLVGQVEWNKYGKSVALSDDGSILALGAPGIPSQSTTEGSTVGRVLVFGWDGVSWNQLGDTLSYNSIHDAFGESVSLSSDGTVLATGAPWTSQGDVRIFDWDGTDWNEKGSLITGEIPGGSLAGISVNLYPNGEGITFGARANDGNLGSGAVRTYEWDGSDWVQNINAIPGDTTADEFGNSTSMSFNNVDTLLAVGAHKNDESATNAGKVSVYKRQGLTWIPYGSPILGEAANDWYGYSVALSGNGERLIVGGVKHNANGLGSGHVQVFEWNGSDWQLMQEFEGDAPNDELGTAVVMNYNGTILAFGAPFNDGQWTNAGLVRVYEDGIQNVTALTDLNMRVYPNPVNDVLHVEGGEGEMQYAIVDITGRVVLSGALENASVNLSGLNAGVYTLQLQNEGRVSSEVIVKE